MTARYTTHDLLALASDRGPFFADSARQALAWAARTLEAADRAVQDERLRADAAKATERERCAKVAEDFLTRGRSPLGPSVAAAIRGPKTAKTTSATTTDPR